VIDATEIHFDGWVLSPRSGELLFEGNTQRLPQQPLRVLLELLEHPGQVVTREQLVQVLWPKGVVDFDNSLNAVVRKLRVALKDDSEKPRFIETLPRIGYRFIGTIAPPRRPEPEIAAPMPAVARPSRARWLIPVVAAAVALGSAVLWWQSTRSSAPSLPAARPQTGDSAARTANQRAYQFYLDGKFHRSRRDVDGNPLAFESFNAALREDPYFAEAWAALAETYTGAGITQHMPLATAMEQARSAALRAIELKPELAAGHASLGTLMMHYDFDYAGAEKEFIAARALDDHYARIWHSYGLLRGYQGRTDEAREYIGRARELEPMTLLYAASYASLLYQTRRYDEAIEYIRPLLASQPRFDQARGILIRSLVEKGDIKGALEQLPLRFSEVPLLSDEGLVYARAGRRDDALRQLQRLERREGDGYGLSYEMAIIYAALGQTQEACDVLRRAPGDHSQTLGWLRLDPRMDTLRKQPCYTEVAERLFGTQ
jgi:DNA-binding winged helix-turn-helix (wHTH) protein/tetratricopeptide (TPR) repeat protein